MTQHTLQGRSEREILWFQRRSFLQAAATWTALGGLATAQAQSRSNVVERQGDVLLNGRPLLPEQSIASQDHIETGPDSHLVFVIGNASFQVRQNTSFVGEPGPGIDTVSVLRLLTGAVASVWGKGTHRQIILPTLTAGIRGTGVYAEVFQEQGNRSYFCNCYGEVELSAGGDQAVSRSSYHQSFWGEVTPKNGRFLTPATAINHTDEELEYLARLVDQQTAWQTLGKKGIKDGKGYMDALPGQQHPAEPLTR